MSRPDWARVSALFAAALERPVEERRSFVDREAGHDPALHAEVLSLLDADRPDRALDVEARLLTADGALQSDAPGWLAPGTRLGPYEIQSLAGEGGMGEVYRAERVDGSYRQTVAIKVLRTGFQTAETMRRFRLERELLARLVHPDIAPILDAGTTPDGRPFLVLQFVDGVAITEYAESRQLGLRARLRLFQRVTRAVHYAHSRLIVHRDLKPSNILVDAQGDVRLLDFGVAKLLDAREAESLALATRPEARILTPEHAAPEQLRGEPVGTATDVYALGVLLYEILCGQRPFRARGRTPAELERVILEEEPAAPSAVAPPGRAREIRGDLDRIVAMAMRKEADRRYASASQLADDIDRFLTGMPVLAQRDTLGYRARKFVRRNRTLVSSLSLGAVLLAAFAASTFAQARRLEAERDRAEAERAAADDLVSVVTGLFERANPQLVPGGDTVRVLTLLEEADRQVDALAAYPDRQARLQRTLGKLYLARGDYPRARTHLLAAWRSLAAQRGEADLQTALIYHELATAVASWEGTVEGRMMLDSSVARLRAMRDVPRATLAAALLDRAVFDTDLAAQRAALDEVVDLRRDVQVDSLQIAALLNAEASTLRGQQAAALFEASLRILLRLLPPDHPNVITVTGNLVTSFTTAGDFERADSLARALFERLPASTSADARANHEERLALIAAHLGRLEEAEHLMRNSLDRLATAVGPEHWRTANSLRNLGLIRIARGELTDGLALLDSALAHLVGRDDSRVTAAYITGQRAAPLLRLGRTATARRSVRDAAVLYDLVPRGHYALADLPFWQGMVLLAEGDEEEAARQFELARIRRRESLPATHPKVLEAACALGVARARAGTVLAAEDAGEPATCASYARWGLADPLLLNWARETGQIR